MGSVLVFVTIGLIAAGAAYGSYLLKKRRREAFALVATQLGLQYSPEDPFGTLGEPFALFEKGDGRGVENVVWGTWQELDVRVFDYWYYEESTDSHGRSTKDYHRFDCAIAPIDAACSRLVIGHENIGTWLAGALTFDDIQFESEGFNKAYHVKSPDAKFANDLIDARMIDWLLASGDGYSFELDADRLLCFCRKVGPMEIIPLLGTAKAFRDHIPRVVYSLYPRAAPFPPAPKGDQAAANEAKWLAGRWTPDDTEGGPVAPPEGKG